MRKKHKKLLAWILIAAFIIGGLIYASNKGILPFAVSGPSYLSISDIDLIDSGQRIMILATGGSAEQLLIRFSDSQLNSKLASEGYMVEKGINVDILINKWQYNYPIDLTSNTFKTLGVQDLTPYIGSEFSCDLSDCSVSSVPKLGTYIFAYAHEMSSFPGKFNCRCVYYNPSDRVGQFLGDIQQLNYNINFKIGSETASMNKDNLVISLANGDFRAEYVGNLGTLFQRSKPGYDVLYKNGAYQNLIPSAGYNYPGKYGSIGSPLPYLKQCIGNVDLSTCTWLTSGCADEVKKVNGCLNQYNSDLSIGSSNKNTEYKTNNQVESMSFSGNSLIVNSQIPTFQPVFKIIVDAEYVGLKELKGEPQITSCAPSVEIIGGTSKQVSLKVRNIGKEAGQFDYSVSCQSNQVSFSGAGSSVDAGQEATINVLFSGTNTNPADLIGSCTHKIIDRKSQKSVSCTSSYKVKYNALICTPGQLRCSTSNTHIIERCNELGNAWETYQNCGVEFCILKDGTPSCGGKEPPVLPKKELNIIYLIPFMVALGMSLLLGWRGKKRTGKYNIVDFIIGAVLGGIIGLIVYIILKNWVVVLLLSFLGVGGTIALILLIGGLPFLMWLILLASGKR